MGDFTFFDSGKSSFNNLATEVKLHPWSKADVRTMKNTILNIKSAYFTPASIGKVARTIGTAPRKPTHETNVFSFNDVFENKRLI